MKNTFKIGAFVMACMAVSSVSAQMQKGNEKTPSNVNRAMDGKKHQQNVQSVSQQKQQSGNANSNVNVTNPGKNAGSINNQSSVSVSNTKDASKVGQSEKPSTKAGKDPVNANQKAVQQVKPSTPFGKSKPSTNKSGQ